MNVKMPKNPKLVANSKNKLEMRNANSRSRGLIAKMTLGVEISPLQVKANVYLILSTQGLQRSHEQFANVPSSFYWTWHGRERLVRPSSVNHNLATVIVLQARTGIHLLWTNNYACTYSELLGLRRADKIE